MKKIEIIIQPEMLERVRDVLDSHGCTGVMVTNIMGYGNQKGYTTNYRGSISRINLLPKLRVETVIADDRLEDMISAIEETLSSDRVGAGKIFIYPVEDAVRIRTRERGDAAL